MTRSSWGLDTNRLAEPKCGARRGPRADTCCELSATHVRVKGSRHTGRDRSGRLYSWAQYIPPHAEGSVASEERRREMLVRSLPCPCGANAGRACRYDTAAPVPYAHTVRYNVAAEHGLGPPLPKVAA